MCLGYTSPATCSMARALARVQHANNNIKASSYVSINNVARGHWTQESYATWLRNTYLQYIWYCSSMLNIKRVRNDNEAQLKLFLNTEHLSNL